MECIKLTGQETVFSHKVRAHDKRALSSSWALFNDATITEIQNAAYWSNPESFISCYFKDVLEGNFGRAALAAPALSSVRPGPGV